ncbi:hypothetical protein Cassandra_0089 [Pseudomonas phage Cassandra]|nr:hypothetical protein Cassandra_0089 [Pseudomonas phage Cassandra]
MNIIPLHNNIIVTNFKKGERTVGGIIFTDDNGKSHGIRARWAQVSHVREDQKDTFVVGQWVLIKHGRWSRPVHTTEQNVYYCAEIDSILLISDEEPEDNIIVETRVYN